MGKEKWLTLPEISLVSLKKQEEILSLSIQIIHLVQILGSCLISASCTSYLWDKLSLLM